ncbi:MAG: polysaccharide biosynthesis C-terminal domain-containing protein [Rubrobacter sp.]|nr:polysaccharide biosynthesis C-terminal domain-containing protein [Rubrobacter sp.]
MAIVTFPVVARAAAARRTREVEQVMENNLKMASALILPAAAYMIIFAPELVALLFQRGAFTPEDTAATASILRIYSLGLLAQTLIFIVVRPFFTYGSSIWIPARAALIGLAVTVAVDVALLQSLGANGLAAGNATGISVMVLLLIRDMRRRVNVNPHGLASFFVRVFGAVLLAGSCALPLVLLELFSGLPAPVTLLLGGLVIGVTYLFIGRLLGIKELEELQDQARRVLRRRGRK